MTKNNYNGDYKRLLNYYFTWLFNALKTTILSKQYIVWQDVFDDGVQLSPDTVIQIWKEKSQRSVVNVTERGYRVILSSDWYISFVHGRSDWHKFYKVEPAAFLRTEQQRELVLGGEACLWGEFVHGANLIPRLWPRASAVAERLWSNQFVNNPTDAISRLEEHTCRMLKRGINAEPQNGPGYCEADIFL